jgi:hypothetical protein
LPKQRKKLGDLGESVYKSPPKQLAKTICAFSHAFGSEKPQLKEDKEVKEKVNSFPSAACRAANDNNERTKGTPSKVQLPSMRKEFYSSKLSAPTPIRSV